MRIAFQEYLKHISPHTASAGLPGMWMVRLPGLEDWAEEDKRVPEKMIFFYPCLPVCRSVGPHSAIIGPSGTYIVAKMTYIDAKMT